MLAPYIPMDDDFQLRSFDQLSPLENSSVSSPSSMASTNVASANGFQSTLMLSTPTASDQIKPTTAKHEEDSKILVAPVQISIEDSSTPASPGVDNPSRTPSPSQAGKGTIEQKEDPNLGTSPNLLTVTLSKR